MNPYGELFMQAARVNAAQQNAAQAYNMAQQQGQWWLEQSSQLGAAQMRNHITPILSKLDKVTAGPPAKPTFTATAKEKKNMIREYLNKHRDTVFTIAFALLIDQFVLGGALRQRIQKVVEAALSRVEKALNLKEDAGEE